MNTEYSQKSETHVKKMKSYPSHLLVWAHADNDLIKEHQCVDEATAPASPLPNQSLDEAIDNHFSHLDTPIPHHGIWIWRTLVLYTAPPKTNIEPCKIR